MVERVNSFAELAAKLEDKTFLLKTKAQKAVAEGAVKVQSTAKSKFGTYQPGVGGFPAWAPLAESTIKQKERAGGGEDPLIGHYVSKRGGRAGGQLRGSILTQIGVMEATVGTNDKIGTYQEFGTSRIPPRPFLRPALYQNQAEIMTAFRKALLDTLNGR
jgi:HK97 gp10 family phage protein